MTVFKDGTSILLPPVLGGDEGLYFYNFIDMEKMINSRIYPVKGTQSFWEKEKERVLNFSNEIPHYCSELSKMLEYKVEINNDTAYLYALSKVVNEKLKLKENDTILYNYLAIFIGELLRVKIEGEWKLLPQNSLNVYYIPEITKDDEFCNHWSFIINELKIAKITPIDIQYLVNKAGVFFPQGRRKYFNY